MRYSNFKLDKPTHRPCRVCFAATLLGLPFVLVVLLLAYVVWIPTITATTHLNDLNAAVTVKNYMGVMTNGNQYVSVQRRGKTLESAVENFDWAHHPRLSIYRLPDENIGAIGPYGSSGIVFDFASMTIRAAKSTEVETWEYLGAFDRDGGVVGPILFLTPGESAECLETNTVDPGLSRLSVRKRRCAGR